MFWHAQLWLFTPNINNDKIHDFILTSTVLSCFQCRMIPWWSQYPAPCHRWWSPRWFPLFPQSWCVLLWQPVGQAQLMSLGGSGGKLWRLAGTCPDKLEAAQGAGSWAVMVPPGCWQLTSQARCVGSSLHTPSPSGPSHPGGISLIKQTYIFVHSFLAKTMTFSPQASQTNLFGDFVARSRYLRQG